MSSFFDDDGHFIALVNMNFSLTVTQPSGEASRVNYLNSMSLVGYTPCLKIIDMSWVKKHFSHISLVFGSLSKQVWTSVLQCFVTLLQLLQRPCRMRQWRVLCSRREDKLRIPNGWLCHLAPELIQQLSSDTEEDKLPFSKQSDVFAFGWVLFYFILIWIALNLNTVE